MSEEYDNLYVPDPQPMGIDPRISEWVSRELQKINQSTIDKVGMHGQDGAWFDNLTAIGAAGRSGNPPVLTSVPGITSLYAWQFADATAPNEQQVFVVFHINHDYKRNTKLYPHVHSFISDAGDIGNTVRWGFEYTVAKGHGQEAFPATTTVTVDQTYTAVLQHEVTEVIEANAIDGANIEPDTVIWMRMYRNSSDAADTAGSNVFALFVDLHYQIERTGTINKAPNFYKR